MGLGPMLLMPVKQLLIAQNSGCTFASILSDASWSDREAVTQCWAKLPDYYNGLHQDPSQQ